MDGLHPLILEQPIFFFENGREHAVWALTCCPLLFQPLLPTYTDPCATTFAVNSHLR